MFLVVRDAFVNLRCEVNLLLLTEVRCLSSRLGLCRVEVFRTLWSSLYASMEMRRDGH